jgi:hypothetical protein
MDYELAELNELAEFQREQTLDDVINELTASGDYLAD